MCTGDSEVIGSWKIIAISRPRIARICVAVRVERGEVDRAGRPSRRSRMLAADDPAGRRDDLQDRAGVIDLPQPDLADDAERLAAPDVEIDAVDGPDDALAVGEEVRVQVRGSRAGRASAIGHGWLTA